MKKKNPRSEKAMREAIREWNKRDGALNRFFVYPHEVHFKRLHDGETIAIFDLRDCYRKRKPLTGIMKKVRKAIRPAMKKKARRGR